jgi:hypothetical protein
MKVRIDSGIGFHWKFYLYEELSNGDISVVNYTDAGRETIIVPVTESTNNIKPTFELPLRAIQPLIQALSEAGVKTPDVSFMHGELNATKNHLKDMRELVFQEEKVVYDLKEPAQ